MSYQLLGKLGTRQCFQKVSSPEIAQSSEEGHKNVDAYIMQVRVRLSCMPSLCMPKFTNRDQDLHTQAHEQFENH
jgi:hypothetical protein